MIRPVYASKLLCFMTACASMQYCWVINNIHDGGFSRPVVICRQRANTAQFHHIDHDMISEPGYNRASKALASNRLWMTEWAFAPALADGEG